MAESRQKEAGLYTTEHGHLTERTDVGPEEKHRGPEPEHGSMDITEHKRTFEGFIKFWIYLFGATAAVLIFLAIFAT